MEEYKEVFDNRVLIRYLDGSGTDRDKELIMKWLEDPEIGHEVEKESFLFWERSNPGMKTGDYNDDHILDRIHHRINLSSQDQLPTPVRRSFVVVLTRIAAILFIPLLLASVLLYYDTMSPGSNATWAEIHSPYGTRTDFSLPDGSKGWLNGGSSLQFPARFSGNKRKVALNGEAFFEVITNPRKPFIVSTGNIDVKVTGTAFNVMAYADEENTEVTLKSGRVEIYSKRSGFKQSIAILKPEETFTFDNYDNSGLIQHVNISDRLSWIDGKLTFKYEPFEEVVKKLNRWYNVNIQIKDTLLNSYVYYGTFQNETLDEVLKLLQFTAPIKYNDLARVKRPDGTFEKRKIEIYNKL